MKKWGSLQDLVILHKTFMDLWHEETQSKYFTVLVLLAEMNTPPVFSYIENQKWRMYNYLN